MRFSTISGALAVASTVSAFSDTNPFLLFSTQKLSQPANIQQLQTSTKVLRLAQDLLQDCPTNKYLVVSQPSINSADLVQPSGCALPHLCRALDREEVQTEVSVAEVFGTFSVDEVSEFIKTSCAGKGKQSEVSNLILPALPRAQRAQQLSDNDYMVGQSLETLSADDSYTVIYLSGPGEATYQAEFQEQAHMDLKRNINAVQTPRDTNSTTAHPPLFERYVFFSPGIFLGIVVTIVLLSILTVGVRALGSLSVPYGAFEKEMGPAAQKKQN